MEFHVDRFSGMGFVPQNCKNGNFSNIMLNANSSSTNGEEI